MIGAAWDVFNRLMGGGGEVYQLLIACINSDPLLVAGIWLFDGSTFLAYGFMGSLWFYFGRKLLARPDLVKKWVPDYLHDILPAALVLYGLFIVLCGVSHLMHILMLHVSWWRLSLIVSAGMASVSVGTAILTAKIVLDIRRHLAQPAEA